MPKVESGLFGGRVPFIRCGSGNKSACVFLGANALFRRLDRTSKPARYIRQMERLLPDHRITVFGYAGSDFGEIVGDMAEFIATPPDVLVGISFGGFVATRFAAQHPALVRRLVLLVSAHRFSAEGRRRMDRQFDALERGDLTTLLRENALLFRRPWYNWLVRLKLWKDRNRLTADLRRPDEILRDYRQLFGPEFSSNAEYAKRITCPALVIGGTADQLFDRAVCEETAALIPGAELQMFPGETHMLPVEKSSEVARVIRKFESRL